jgi:hypothetical protein
MARVRMTKIQATEKNGESPYTLHPIPYTP